MAQSDTHDADINDKSKIVDEVDVLVRVIAVLENVEPKVRERIMRTVAVWYYSDVT